MTTNELRIGGTVGNYRLIKYLGGGASGAVWQARSNSRTVALKIMNEQLAHGDGASKHIERMKREMELLKQLNHPNIPKLYDSNFDADPPYLVMDFINSPSFQELINNGAMFRFSLEKRMELIDFVAQALQAVHDEGIIHRDIKPDNIRGTEKPYLLDFSIALPAEDVNQTNMGIGTPLYMELLDKPDELGDIYSFALVAYQMLFKLHPIFPNRSEISNRAPGDVWLLAQERLKTNTWLLPSRAKDIPPELVGMPLEPVDRVFARALGDRKERYSRVSDFDRDLRTALGFSKMFETDLSPHVPVHSKIESDPIVDYASTGADNSGDNGDRRMWIAFAGLVAGGLVLLVLNVLRLAWLVGIL